MLYMKNYKLMIGALLLGAGAFYSCEDGLKENLTENKVYIVSSGLQEFEIYKTGEPSTYQLAIINRVLPKPLVQLP